MTTKPHSPLASPGRKGRRFRMPTFSRREVLRGSVALAAYTLAAQPLSVVGLPAAANEELIPWLDAQPKARGIQWQDLTTWITANEHLYEVSHYPKPKIDREKWRLEVTGYVKRPRSFTLADLKKRRQRSIHATLECGGNGASMAFMGAIGNLKWTGTPLGPLLRECGLVKRSQEVVFYGADEKAEKIREHDYDQNFARSLSLDHALADEVLLAWAMNDKPLDDVHGAPLRLVVPGWFGIAWVKWLTRIDLLDRRFMGKWMAREYVTIRGEERPPEDVNWRETSVCNINVKSLAARAVRRRDGSIRISGAAWSDGTPLQTVDLKIDEGPWQPVSLDPKPRDAKYTWTLWHFDWRNPAPGEHTIVSRASDKDGRVQPPAEDPLIKLKKTYWEANQQWPRKIRV